MSIPSTTRSWILQNRPSGFPNLDQDSPSSTFKLTTREISPPTGSEVLVKTLYLSNDPAQRGWISADIPEERLYVPPVQVGSPMRARAVAEVVATGPEVSSFKKGDVVVAGTNWNEYAVLAEKDCQPATPIPGVGPTHYLGALGLTGLTAWHGIKSVGETTADDVVVVSGAAGATGSMVVQIAKNMIGCKRVIGIAGGKNKCDWVKSLGADECIDYKSEGWQGKLKEVSKAAGGVNVYFDNVGGETLDLMLTCMAKHGRVIACGAISVYNSASHEMYGIKNWFEVISMSLQIRGFIVLNYMSKARETVATLVQGIKDGKLKVTDEMETVVETKFEDIPKTWIKLFSGGNQGKLVTSLKSS